MIFDLAKNLDFYRKLGMKDRYAKAVDFLKNNDLEGLPPGRYEIDGGDVFANVMEYTTVTWEEAKFESHRDYTDIQYMIRGSETMTYAPAGELKVEVPYNEEQDCALYDDGKGGLRVVVREGEYMIFNPWDAHKPKVCHGQPAPIKKVIVKIKEKE